MGLCDCVLVCCMLILCWLCGFEVGLGCDLSVFECVVLCVSGQVCTVCMIKLYQQIALVVYNRVIYFVYVLCMC